MSANTGNGADLAAALGDEQFVNMLLNAREEQQIRLQLN